MAQGRQGYFNNIDAVIQILAELFVVHHGCQVFIAGGNDSDIGSLFGNAAKGRVFAFLKYPKQPDLKGRACVSDFIKKNRTIVCQGKMAGLVFYCMGECPFFISKQLRLQQRIRQGPAVYGHKRVILSVTGVVNGPCH